MIPAEADASSKLHVRDVDDRIGVRILLSAGSLPDVRRNADDRRPLVARAALGSRRSERMRCPIGSWFPKYMDASR